MSPKTRLTSLSLALLSAFVVGEAEGQGLPPCPTFGSGVGTGITEACTISGGTYQIGMGPIYQWRTPGVTGMVTNTGTLTTPTPTFGTNVFNVYTGADYFNVTNLGTINGSGGSAVFNSSAPGVTASIINAGNIYTANTGTTPFTVAGTLNSNTAAIGFTNPLSVTLDNRAGANIVGAANGVRIIGLATNAAMNNSVFQVTNAGRIENVSTVLPGTSAMGSSGVYLSLGGATTGVDSASFINNEATGLIRGTTAGLRLTRASGAPANSLSNFSITNRGTIEGVSGPGIVLGLGTANITLNNHGTISGSTSAIEMSDANGTSGGNHVINIHPGAVFNNGINFANTTGNTLNFRTGSYTLGVKNYNLAGNTIALLGTGNEVVTSGVVAGTGNIVVVAPPVVEVLPAATNNAAAVSNVVNSVAGVAPALSQAAPVVPPPSLPAVQGAIPATPPPPAAVLPPAQGVAPGFSPSSSTLLPPVQGISPDVPGADGATRSSGSGPFGGAAFRPGNGLLLASADPGVAQQLLLNRQGMRVDAAGNVTWVRGFGSVRRLPSSDQLVGHSNYTAGLMFGADTRIGEGRRVGVYGGYSQGRTEMNDASGRLANDYYIVGTYVRGTAGDYVWQANVSGGLIGNRTNRFINNGAEEATARFDSLFVAPELSVARSHVVSPGWALTPTLRGRYVGVFMPKFSESGSSQDVVYAAQNAHSLEQRLELKLTRTGNDAERQTSLFYVQAAAIATQRIGNDDVNANVLGSDFIVRNPHDRNVEGVLIGLGLDHYELRRNVSLFGGLDVSRFTEKSSALVGRVGLRVSF